MKQQNYSQIYFMEDFPKFLRFSPKNLEVTEKVLIFAASIIWLTIQVSFLRGQAVYVTTHFKAALMCGFIFSSYLRKLFIIIFKNPLLVAMLRLIDISLFPENINTSMASGEISKCRLISSVILRIP